MTNKPIRIAVAGGGNVGCFIAQDLVSRGHDVVVIEQSRDVVETLERDYDF